MKATYRSFFGLQKEPFGSDLPIEDILLTSELSEVTQRFEYTLRIGGVGVLTGEIGSGKSTALRYACAKLHPAEYASLYLTATTGSILEIYRQILTELGIEKSSASKASLTGLIRQAVIELVEAKKMKVALIIDEASLLRLEVFAELHTLCQFDKDSKPYLPLILAGQSLLIDKLSYRDCAPLASRVICRAHLQGLDKDAMQQYLLHHLKLAGIKKPLFDETAITAIHQGSGGLLRKANHLARGRSSLPPPKNAQPSQPSMSASPLRKCFKPSQRNTPMSDPSEELVYEEKIDRITVQLEELILDALMTALEKIRERNELFRRLQTKSADDSPDF